MTFEIDYIGLQGKFNSLRLGRSVRFRWVAPPQYESATDPFPVLLMNDGQDFHALGLERTLSAAYRSEEVKPFLLIALETNANRIHEYGTASAADFKGRGAKAGAYSAFITEEFIPFLKKTFRVSTCVSDWVFCGMSLGGLSAFDIVFSNPQLFGGVGVFSGSFWWRRKAYLKDDVEDRSRIVLNLIRDGRYAPQLRFWFQCGTEDETADRNNSGTIDAINDTLDVIRELELKGFTRPGAITYVEINGGKHDPRTWGRTFPGFLEWAFGRPDGPV